MNSRVTLLLVLCINLMLFVTQVSMDEVSSLYGLEGGNSIYDYEGNILSSVDTGNLTVKNTYSDEFPDTSSTITATEGNWFTDTFTTIKEWFLQTTGISYGIAFVNAVPNMLGLMGLPQVLVFGIGAVWHIFTVFLLIMSFRGGD